jgi:hypothetical protein
MEKMLAEFGAMMADYRFSLLDFRFTPLPRCIITRTTRGGCSV